MPRQPLDILLQRDFDTLTRHAQCRLLTAALRGQDTPYHILFKRELPLCGARCRDGHPCKARATRDQAGALRALPDVPVLRLATGQRAYDVPGLGAWLLAW